MTRNENRRIDRLVRNAIIDDEYMAFTLWAYPNGARQTFFIWEFDTPFENETLNATPLAHFLPGPLRGVRMNGARFDYATWIACEPENPTDEVRYTASRLKKRCLTTHERQKKMKERPILFSGPMVRAILAGQKTQTRRVMKAQMPNLPAHCTPSTYYDKYEGKLLASYVENSTLPNNPETLLDIYRMEFAAKTVDGDNIYCPYGSVGDRLWVRETWCGEISRETAQVIWNPDGNSYKVLYAADGHDVAKADDDGGTAYNKDGSESSPWKSSIHMPRWASRITLKIVSVRVERLNDITQNDIACEGMRAYGADAPSRLHEIARADFASVWDSINGKKVGCEWAANPWVWVVEFEVMKGAKS